MLGALIPSIILFTIYIIIAIYLLKAKSLSWTKHITLLIFAVYIILVISITIFPLPIDPQYIADQSGMKMDQRHNFEPFREINRMLEFGGLFMVLKQIGGNILLLVPLGLILPILIKTGLFRTVFIGFLISVSIELTQWSISLLIGFPYRSVDIDDVILNTFGVAIGYTLFSMIYWIYKFVRE